LVQFWTMAGLKKVSFGTSIIQKSRRVALDPNLLDTLELKEGDKVRVELDIDSETILIRKAVATPTKRSKGGELARA
jgi:antitoxin component of MazEF toxin-antitoxin module